MNTTMARYIIGASVGCAAGLFMADNIKPRWRVLMWIVYVVMVGGILILLTQGVGVIWKAVG